VKPNTKAELVSGIAEFWKNTMTVEKCQRYVNHVYTIIPQVIEAKGGCTAH
jgi:hypothetical protein